jgi:hypothetical protein
MTLLRANPTCLLFVLLIFFSCHKKDIMGAQGPQGPQGPVGISTIAQGNIEGKVALYDISGNALPSDSGAIVSLDSTTPVFQAVSGTDGSFTIYSVHEGAYNLSVQKQGFGTMHYYNFSHAGTTTPSQTGLLSLGQQMPSQFDVKQLRVDSGVTGQNNYIVFTVILAHPETVTNPVLIYFNDSSGVGNTANRFVFRATFYQQNDTTLTYGNYYLPLTALTNKLHNADNLYLCAAIDNGMLISYADPQGNQVFPAAGKPSPEIIVNNVLHKY